MIFHLGSGRVIGSIALEAAGATEIVMSAPTGLTIHEGRRAIMAAHRFLTDREQEAPE
jgi:hypothetical protein